MEVLGGPRARRILVEGAVIVASILAAFGIQAWWDGRLEREETRRVLSALVEEARENRTELARMTSYHREALANVGALFDAATDPAAAIPTDSVDRLLANASGWMIPAYDQSALDLTLMGGKLPLIENTALARQIAAWQQSLEQILEFERGHGEFMRRVWMPFLREHVSVPQLSNAQTAILGGGAPYASETPVLRPVDHGSVLSLREFHNILQEKKWTHEDALAVYGSVEVRLDDLLLLLEGEVGGDPASPTETPREPR